MACGCVETCPCCVTDSNTMSFLGSGAIDDCFQGTVIVDPLGGLTTGDDGVGILLDPASTAPVSLSADGLRVDCCEAGGNNVSTANVDTLLTVDNDIVLIDTGANDVEVALPASAPVGTRIDIKWLSDGGFTATISPNGNDLDGSGSAYTFADLLDARQVANIDGFNWVIL